MPAGRPRKQIDPEELVRLIEVGCPVTECAYILGCSVQTLYNNFPTVIKGEQAYRNFSLRKKQFEMAMAGNVTMLIWVGKQLLGQRESPIVIEDGELVKDLLKEEDYRTFARLLTKARNTANSNVVQ